MWWRRGCESGPVMMAVWGRSLVVERLVRVRRWWRIKVLLKVKMLLRW